MKKVLFATTATAALAIGGMASAQGISLFGSARLGLGYNINSDGSARFDDPDTAVVETDTPDDLTAVSRVRFGVNMTGETNSGITFGATIRADNAIGGNGGARGMTDGNVFVSGSFGTLTFGDTNGADEQWVGDLMGNYSLTGLGDFHETIFLSNGGSFGNDVSNNFFADPQARPTVRYDFEIAGFGISASTNKELDAFGFGSGYAGEFGGGTFEVGLGYYDYTEFTVVDSVLGLDVVPGGKQYSALLGGTFGDFGANVIYNNVDSDGDSFQTLGLGLTAGFGDYDVGAFYRKVIDADGELAPANGADTYGVTAQYDLGGGASVAGGVGRTYGRDFDAPAEDFDGATVADFGIKMAF